MAETMRLMPEEWVREFHEIFGASIAVKPNVPLTQVRRTLLKEEWEELDEELALLEETNTITPNLIKEMTDLQYVLSGLAVVYNIDLNKAVEIVHQSNLSKLGDDGKPIFRGDGKFLKGKNYVPADVSSLVPNVS